MGCLEKIGTDSGARPTAKDRQDHMMRDIIVRTRMAAKINCLEMFGKLDKGDWLDLFALERLVQRSGPKVVGEFSLPAGHTIDIITDKGEVVLTAHKKMEFESTLEKITAARKELFKEQPAWMEHAFETARPKMPQEQEAAAVKFREVLEAEYKRLVKSNSQGRTNRELILKQHALEDLLEKKPGVECKQANGNNFLVALTIRVKHEFTDEEISKRAAEIEKTL